MDFLFDLSTNTLTLQGVSANAVTAVKWRGREPVRIAFQRAGVPELLPVSSDLALYLVNAGTLLAEVVSWTVPETASGWYEGELQLHTTPLTTAFATATVKRIGVAVECHWSAPGESSIPAISDNLVSLEIQRPVILPEPSSPATLTGGDEWLSARAVRYDIAQDLTDEEKARARANIGAGTGDGSGSGDVGSAFHSATAKTTPVDADTMPLIDSTASNVLKKVTWANIKATLKSYFDTLYAAISHTHSIANVTGLQTALDGKASTSHTHAIADVTSLQTALDGKAATSHTHSIGNVTGLQTALDGKATTSHTHAIADVTGLQTALDGKEGSQTAASQAEAEAGTETAVRKWSPLRINQAILALAPAGGGADGASAYEIAVTNGFSGSEAEWLDSLVGNSAYQVAVSNGFSGTEAQWLDSLIGDTGATGATGEPGIDAYQVAVNNGFVGTSAQWLNSLIGATGATGPAGSDATVNATNVASTIHGVSAKTTPVDADTMPIIDSAASNGLKKVTWANIKATLKTYFDTLYQAAGSYLTAATSAEAKAATSTTKGITPANLNDYTAPQTLTDGATIAWNMALGVNANVTLGGNRTLGAPTNIRAGSSGLLTITQDGTGSRTLAYASAWKFAGGTAPVLTTTAGARDLLAWYSPDGSTLLASLTKAYA